MLLEGEYRIIISWSEYKRILQNTESLNFRGVATALSKTSPGRGYLSRAMHTTQYPVFNNRKSDRFNMPKGVACPF